MLVEAMMLESGVGSEIGGDDGEVVELQVVAEVNGSCDIVFDLDGGSDIGASYKPFLVFMMTNVWCNFYMNQCNKLM